MFVSVTNAGVYRTGISERSDVIKTTESNKYHICHYWYILEKDFKYESYICNDCYGLMQKAIYFSDVQNLFLVYEQKECNKCNEKFSFK